MTNINYYDIFLLEYKKGGVIMKKTLLIVALIAILAISVFALTGCGKK